MGFEIKRFQGDVDEELICPICSGVLEDPLQAPACEHAFCRACITEWIGVQPTCPVDRQAVTACQLRPVPRILRNLLSRLHTSCDNAPHGCNAVLKLESLASHLLECEFNPKRPIPCEAGCGLVIPKDELAEHNCLRELRALISSQQSKLTDFQQELSEQRLVINEHKQELALLKEFMRAMRVSNPTMRALADQMERDEVSRWAGSLTRARVTRWGGMISTPDDVLQMMIKRSLSESGCPPHIIDDLMENCHERRWPPGLCSLEIRQNNRRLHTSCDNAPHGCNAVLKLESLASHLLECEFNPKRPIPCEAGCGLVIPKDELAEHNCLRELRALISSQQSKLTDFQQELSEQRLVINEHKQELALLKEFMRAMRVSNPTMRALADQMERDEVSRWAGSLTRARVTRWGGMISTPDDVLQMMIKRSLSESGCPPHIIDDLMENCHERRWPPGLCSLEIRQNNRRLYEKYICKRVPGKQAVLVLQCDNTHVDEHMMVEPGLVMIFAHGIE